MDIGINIIGPGKVGRTLMTLAAATPGVTLYDVAGRRPGSAAEAVALSGAGQAVDDSREMRPADLWLLTVPDDRIAESAASLAAARHPPAAVLHCSGFLSSAVLAPLTKAGWSVASCHPVLSFSDPAMAAARFPGTCCAIEGDAPAALLATTLVERLGGVPFPVDPAKKPLYHAAAVFSNNFATVLQAVAREAWAEAGVPAEIAERLNETLLSGTAEAVARLGPAAALTGPAARGDTKVMRRQSAAVTQWHPDAGALYDGLSLLAARLKETGRTLGNEGLDGGTGPGKG